MPKRPARIWSGILAICLAVAALQAPPSALALTASGTGTTPAASGTGTTPAASGTGTTPAASGTGTTPAASGTGTTPAPAPTPVPRAPADPVVRVGLAGSLASASVTSVGSLYVVAEGAVHWVTPAGTTVRLTQSGDRIQVVGLAGTFASPVRIVAGGVELTGAVGYAGKRYRGELEVIIAPDTRKLAVVNALNLEEYVQGVVPAEMPSTWPAEALKAQAVAARAYARAKMATGGVRRQGYDLLPNTYDQAYGGWDVERPTSTAAVTATRGQILTYRPALDKPVQLATGYFFSSSGGHTEDSENVWTYFHSYLRGVPDFDNLPGNFRFAWKNSFTPDEVSARFKEKGYEVGAVESIQPDPVVSKSGRPTQWHVVGTLNGQSRTTVLNGERMRSVLGLFAAPKQILFKVAGLVSGNRELGPKETVAVVGADKTVRQRQVQGTIILGGKLAIILDKANVLGPKVAQAAGVEVQGGGWGHGVGMSQWGAHGMALLGKNYREILAHYYTGVQVEIR